jgi:MOSC domain-containing protein YiiM
MAIGPKDTRVKDSSMGTVARVSVKPRISGEVGLPKGAVPSLRVTLDGAEGDYNNYRARTLGGDRDQALLLVTEDLLESLRDEGWPVQPGDLGENLTLTGIREADLGPGVQLRVGEVSVVITKPCEPCTELYTLPYIGEARGPAFLKAAMDRRGWYARVLAPGSIAAGSPVSVIVGAAAT